MSERSVEAERKYDPVSAAFAGGIVWFRERLPFARLQRRWIRQRRRESFAYVFVGVCLLIEGALLATLGVWRDVVVVTTLAAICVLFRYVDLLCVSLEMLFAPQGKAKYGMERNLLLLVLNLAELSLIGTAFLALTTHASIGASWFASFGTLSLYDLPQGGSVLHHASAVAIAVLALLMIVGGLAIILAEIASKFLRSQGS